MSTADGLHESIKNRYEAESMQNCSLGCGTTLQELEIKKGDVVLDLGCGRGVDTISAARLTGTDGRAIGLDLTSGMIKEAIRGAEKASVRNASFVLGDMEALPFQDKTFHAAMSNCVINHARDKKKVYREIYRVLKDGGRFVVADAVSKYPLPTEVKRDPEAWAQCFGGAVTEEEYMGAILASGFQKVEILNRREYLKNGYDFISLTIKAVK